MSSKITQTKFSFEPHHSSKGTPLLYIQFKDTSFKLNEEQKRTLKFLLNNYFFYSNEKKKWGFIDKGDNKKEVSDYLKEGVIPDRLNFLFPKSEEIVQYEKITIDLKDYELRFIEVKGRPLFTFGLNNGVVEITINVKHWFFKTQDNSEKEIVKKMVLSHVIACNEFTSPVIDSFNNKLNLIQDSLNGKHL